MFTTEIRDNGNLIGVLFIYDNESCADVAINKYTYDYYEPKNEILKIHNNRSTHIYGSITCLRNQGIRHIINTIFQDIDSKQ